MLKMILFVVEIVEMSTAAEGGRIVMVVVIRRGKTQIQHLIRRK
jgi:hypothetical protein